MNNYTLTLEQLLRKNLDHFKTKEIERVSSLKQLATPAASPFIHVYRASYRRCIPKHYLSNPYIKEIVEINVILVEDGSLVIPATRRSNFSGFFQELKNRKPELFRQIMAPSSTAKSASCKHQTPIKEITEMCLSGHTLPGDNELYGWHELEEESEQKGLNLQVLFQGNGLYFNRGSVFYDGESIHAYPDSFHADILDEGLDKKAREQLGIHENSMKRPLLFFLTNIDGRMSAYYHWFYENETYREGIHRLLKYFRKNHVRSALAASPPLIIPGQANQPQYLSLPEVLSCYHANDVRHYLYCPYQGAVLLSAEIGREQCLHPHRLMASLTGSPEDRLNLLLSETLNHISFTELQRILEEKGYSGRYKMRNPDSLEISPLEGVYSHLIPFLTQNGRFGLIQTSGTRGNVTGNDGPSFHQLMEILMDLNEQSLFRGDQIIAAASGSQGNDVPNVVARARIVKPNLLHLLAPTTLLDDRITLRGRVTTPRVGIGVPE